MAKPRLFRPNKTVPLYRLCSLTPEGRQVNRKWLKVRLKTMCSYLTDYEKDYPQESHWIEERTYDENGEMTTARVEFPPTEKDLYRFDGCFSYTP